MKVDVRFKESNGAFAVAFNSFQVVYGGEITHPIYTGSYSVTPTIKAQTLKTAQKLMEADMVIEKIPYSEVTNLSKGKTVTIA